MLARILRRVSGGLASLPLAYSPVIAADTITKIESRSLPPRVVTQRVFSQLAAKMRFEPYPSGRPKPKLPLSDMQFWTVPRATYVSGLCESNLITVYFEPVGPKKGADTKVAAAGLEASSSFHFLAEPPASQEDVSDAAWARTNKACARLNPEKFFHAKDAYSALAGAIALQKVIQAAQRDMPALLCVFGSEPAEACRQRVAKLSLANMSDVWPCQGADSAKSCQTVWVNTGLSLTIHTVNGGDDLAQVELGELVTTGDERLD